MTNDSLEQSIMRNMQAKDTDELDEIWKKHDQTEWTQEAFDAVRQILLERLGVLPKPDELVEVVEADTYHRVDRLMQIVSWATLVSWVFLIFAIVMFFADIGLAIVNFSAPDIAALGLVVIIYRMINPFLIPLVSLFFFVFLRAIAELIYLLMDIEGNTRSASSAEEESE